MTPSPSRAKPGGKTMTKSQEIQVITVDDEPTCLYHRYPGQFDSQPVYVEIDLENQTISIDWSGETGSAVPVPVYLGRVRRFSALPYAAHVANALLAELAPLAAQLAAEATVEWNGSNTVGVLSDAGEAIENEIRVVIEDYRDEQQVVGVCAGDCFEIDWDRLAEIGIDKYVKELRDDAEGMLFDNHLVEVIEFDEFIEDLVESFNNFKLKILSEYAQADEIEGGVE